MVFEPITAALAAAVVTAVGGEVVARPTNAVLDALLRTNAEQVTLLKRIDRNVEALLKGPFNTGLILLDEARKPSRSPTDRRRDLEMARDAFIAALGNESSDVARAVVIKAYLAVTAHASNDFLLAEDYLEDAHDLLRRGVEASAERPLVARLRRPPPFEVLQEYADAVASLRCALGAHPASVPFYDLAYLPAWGGRDVLPKPWRRVARDWHWRHGPVPRPEWKSRVEGYWPSQPEPPQRRRRPVRRGRLALPPHSPERERAEGLSDTWDLLLSRRTNDLVQLATSTRKEPAFTGMGISPEVAQSLQR